MKIQISEKMMEVKILFSESLIREKVIQIAEQINSDYGKEEPLVILIVLHGALIFAADLIRYLKMPTEIETLLLKSYDGMQSSGVVSLISKIPETLSGKHVLIVEDVVDTGRSIHFLLEKIRLVNPLSVKVCALLNKPEAHLAPVNVDYFGFLIARHFVIGYGLDYNGHFRNLPYIGECLEV